MSPTEAQFTTAVIELAHYRGWRVTHFRPARTSRGWVTALQGDPGFPDLVLARDGVVIFAELKVGKGRLSKAQVAWQEALRGQNYHVWRPEQMAEIAEVLR